MVLLEGCFGWLDQDDDDGGRRVSVVDSRRQDGDDIIEDLSV